MLIITNIINMKLKPYDDFDYYSFKLEILIGRF